MKKLLLVMLMIMLLTTTNVNAMDKPELTDREPVKLYMFWRAGCGYCEMALELFNDLEDEYEDYFEIVTIDVESGSNGTLYGYISEMLGDSGGVPYFVAGESHMAGYSETAVIELALEEYTNDDYYDVVGNYAKGVSGYELGDLEDACEAKGIPYWNAEAKDNSSDNVVVTAVFVVLLGSIGYLIFSPKKN
ncbi:MAG: hypothetical protein R3Y13_04895 [bacterium]